MHFAVLDHVNALSDHSTWLVDSAKMAADSDLGGT